MAPPLRQAIECVEGALTESQKARAHQMNGENWHHTVCSLNSAIASCLNLHNGVEPLRTHLMRMPVLQEFIHSHIVSAVAIRTQHNLPASLDRETYFLKPFDVSNLFLVCYHHYLQGRLNLEDFPNE